MGEEQGLLGSRAYVREHFASRPEPEGEDAYHAAMREERFPRKPLPKDPAPAVSASPASPTPPPSANE